MYILRLVFAALVLAGCQTSQAEERNSAPVHAGPADPVDRPSTDEAGSAMNDHGHVKTLELSGSTDDDLKQVEQLTSLRNLTVRSKQVTGAGIARVGALKQLKTLDLSQSYYVKDVDLEPLTELNNLESVALNMTSITSGAIETLRPLTKLSSLSVRWTSVGDDAIDSLLQMKNLRSLDIRNTSISADGIARLKAERPDIALQAEPPTLVFDEVGVEFWSNGDVVFEGATANIDRGKVWVGRWDNLRMKMRGEHNDSVWVVKFDRRRRAVHLLIQDYMDDEDPPRRQVVLLLEDGKLSKVFDRHLGVYGSTLLRFPGDGTARYVTDDWTAHNSYGNAVHEIFLGLAGNPPKLAVQREVPTGETINPDELSACPFVYVQQGAGPHRLVGEILRNVRGRSAYTLQELPLPGVSDGRLFVRLAEEKDEVTYLDELYIEADGIRVEADACVTSPGKTWCKSDREFHRMVRGNEHVSTFLIPEGAKSVVLYASGYYHPVVSEYARQPLGARAN